MNQLATQQERIPMDSVGVSNTGTGTKIAPQNLGEVVKFAEVMCRADIALPKHLRGNAGACMAVAMQALEWQMSPFAVASKSYAVNGAIAYEAQLIAAVVNTRSGIKGRLRYQFEGEGSALTCTVTGMLDGDECVYKSPTLGSITTKNSPLWKSDPQQQLGYFAARSWARRHCPEVILGVYDRDEAEEFRGPDRAKDITSQVVVDPFSDEPIAATQGATEEREAYAATEGQQSENAPYSGDIEDFNSGTPEPDADAPPPASASEEAGTSPLSASSFQDDELRMHLMDFSRKGLRTVSDGTTAEQQREAIEKMTANYRDVVPESEWGKLSTVKVSLQAVINGKRTVEQARSFLATDILSCDPEEIGGAP